MLRRPRTWLLMACFGLVNGGYASVVAWLAPFYQSHGWSAASSAAVSQGRIDGTLTTFA